MKLVSIIMSVYNEKQDWLKKSIESILNQTYDNFEFIIILDNPNNFEAIKLINLYMNNDNRVVFLQNSRNIGLSESLNKGIRIAKGEYIARMDADDISVLDRIEKQVKYIEKNNIELVSSNIIYVNEEEKEIKRSNFKNGSHTENKKLIMEYDSFIHPTWLLKKRIIDKIGCYRKVNSAEDYDLICRILVNNYKCFVIDEYLLYYRVRENGITNSNKFRQIYETERIKNEYAKSLITNKNYINKMNFDKFDANDFEKFCNSIKKIKKAKEYKKQKKNFKYYIYVIESIIKYNKRLVLKLNIVLAKWSITIKSKLK